MILNKIDLQRLKSSRYSDKNSGEDENFSLTISQYMYKIDNLTQKFEKSMEFIEKSFSDFPPAPQNLENLKIDSQPTNNQDSFLKIKELQERIRLLEGGNYDEKGLERQILSLKEIHSTEIKHLKASHDKIVYELKDINKQKEQRLQERIDLLSKTYDTGKDLYIVRDLQGALDKIRSITKPIYTQKI